MTGPRHILLINIFFAPHSFGGATVVAEAVARELVRNHDRRVTVISAMHRTDLVDYAVMKTETDGIVNYLINLPRGRSYVEIYDNPAVTETVSDLLAKLQPDLVHVHCIQDLGAGLMAAVKAQDLPLVLSVHDFWWLCERQFMIRPDRSYCGQDPIRIDACEGCVEDIARARTRHAALHDAAAQADLITFPSSFAKGLSERSGLTAKRLDGLGKWRARAGAGVFRGAGRAPGRRSSAGLRLCRRAVADQGLAADPAGVFDPEPGRFRRYPGRGQS